MVEFDKPEILVQNENSLFKRMMEASGLSIESHTQNEPSTADEPDASTAEPTHNEEEISSDKEVNI